MSDLFGYNTCDFSPCRKYRYTLWRWWNKSKPYASFICLNPSTADEISDDNTVRRCINYSKDWGYGGFLMLNIFAFRATDPKVMKAQEDPIGPDNDMWIKKLAKDAGVVVAAWGSHGAYMDRGEHVKNMIPGLKCLKRTKSGQPQHPLYLKKDLRPIAYNKCAKG